jgi:hypothetical protein
MQMQGASILQCSVCTAVMRCQCSVGLLSVSSSLAVLLAAVGADQCVCICTMGARLAHEAADLVRVCYL